MTEQEKCAICGLYFEQFNLKKCPTCHKKVCEDCAHMTSGIRFCAKFCSDFFFFGDGEEGD